MSGFRECNQHPDSLLSDIMPTQRKISTELGGRHLSVKGKLALLSICLIFSTNKMNLVGMTLEYSEAQLSVSLYLLCLSNGSRKDCETVRFSGNELRWLGASNWWEFSGRAFRLSAAVHIIKKGAGLFCRGELPGYFRSIRDKITQQFWKRFLVNMCYHFIILSVVI